MKQRKKYSKTTHSKMFYALIGFLIVPFLMMFVQTTTDIAINSDEISESRVFLYLGLVTAMYYVIQAKEGYPYFTDEDNSDPGKSFFLVGLALFFLFLVIKLFA